MGKITLMTRILAVLERDLIKFRRNPVVLAMSFLMPMIYLVILGNSFQGKLKSLPVALVNQDGGPYARQIVNNIKALEAGQKNIRVVFLSDQEAAISGVRAGIYKAAVIIPPDFSRRTAVRAAPEIGLFVDNTDGISAENIRNSIEGAFRALGQEYIPIRERPDSAYLRSTDLFPKVDYYQSLVPGVVIMAIFLGTMTTGAFNLVMDRFLGIDESYLLTPLTKTDIVVGLTVSGLSITTVIAGATLALSMLITGIPIAKGFMQCASIYAVVTLTTLGLLSMMFVILGRVNHPRIVGILTGFLNVILFFPSGAVYPVASFPNWLKAFARVNPEAYAVSALKAILFKGAGLWDIRMELAYLVAFTLVMGTVSIAVFRRTL